jgi:PAS fold
MAESDRSNRTGAVWDLTYRVIARDGGVVWLRSRAEKVAERDGKAIWQGFALDVTSEHRGRTRDHGAHREAEDVTLPRGTRSKTKAR